MHLLVRAVCVVVAVGTVSIVVSRAQSSVAPAVRHADVEERKRLAARVVEHEAEWNQKAADDFPQDSWSQRDAFHNLESNFVNDVAKGAGVSMEDVFRGVDEDIHAHPGKNRNADVVPCKPRPVFD
jgi:hypothetical protein